MDQIQAERACSVDMLSMDCGTTQLRFFGAQVEHIDCFQLTNLWPVGVLYLQNYLAPGISALGKAVTAQYSFDRSL